MPNYQLNFSLTAQQIAMITGSGQNLTIAKQNPASNNPPYNVAWVAFQPTLSDTVVWEVDYSIYATQVQLENGATITLEAEQTASPGDNWNWNGTLFSGPGKLGSQSYGILNQAKNPSLPSAEWKFGLSQEVTVNGAKQSSPLNIVTALGNEQMEFTPIETVYVFLSGYTNNGSVIGSVLNTALTVELTSVSPAANINFNSDNDQFVQVPK